MPYGTLKGTWNPGPSDWLLPGEQRRHTLVRVLATGAEYMPV